MSEAVIIDAVRSPIGIKNGNLVGIRPDDLTAQVVKSLLVRNKKFDPKKVEDLILGCAFPEGPQGMLMAKGVAILAGIPETSAGVAKATSNIDIHGTKGDSEQKAAEDSWEKTVDFLTKHLD